MFSEKNLKNPQPYRNPTRTKVLTLTLTASYPNPNPTLILIPTLGLR